MLNALRRVGRLSNHDSGRLDRIAAKLRLPLDRIYNERILPDIRRLSASVENANVDGPRVLIASLRVWQSHAIVETMIGNALRERGAHISILTCGGGLPICEVGWSRKGYPRPCDRCAHFTDGMARASGFPQYRLADHLPWGSDGRKAPERWQDMVDEAALDYERAGGQTAAWVLKTTSPDTVPDGPDVLRDSAVTAAAVELAANRILDEAKPDIVFAVNGILVEEHVLAQVARARGIRVVTYGFGIHENSIVMSSDVLPALDFKNEPLWEEVRDQPLTDDEAARLDRYLLEREAGVGVADYFTRSDRDPARLKRQLGVAEDKRLIAMFTNITWDSACLYKDVAFPNADEWIRGAVRAVRDRPDCQLVIRVHPAEEWLGTMESAEGAVAHEFPELPANVRFIPAHEHVNSYALIDASDLVLVYTSTTGLEAATRGKRVAVAGDTHYRGRGFTEDLERPEDLAWAVNQAEATLDQHARELARRYAYAYFFRLMTPLPAVVRQVGPTFAKVVDENISLAPGADPYLDLICDRILDGRPLSAPRDLVVEPTPFPPFQAKHL